MKRQFHTTVSYAAAAIAGMALWAVVPPRNAAQGEVRGTPEPQAFQTGGQLSVPVLREISATLRQMDARLARLETIAVKMQSPKTADARGQK